jgi:hypothetical protein
MAIGELVSKECIFLRIVIPSETEGPWFLPTSDRTVEPPQTMPYAIYGANRNVCG